MARKHSKADRQGKKSGITFTEPVVPPKPDGHSPEPWEEEYDPKLDPPWGVFAVMGNVKELVAAIHSLKAPGDAQRLRACVNACAGIPTDSLQANLFGKVWIVVQELCDLVEGKPAPVSDQDAYRNHVAIKARALIRLGPAPR